MRIFIVEDEVSLVESMKKGLELDGYSVDAALNGEEAIYNARVEDYDLVVLDLNLPDMFGLDVLKELTKINDHIKVLILTAHSELEMKVMGLDLGASDYMVKPFHFEELEARIRMLLRRTFVVEKTVLTFGPLSFDTVKRKLFIDGKEVILTRKEGAILEYFLLHQDKLVTAEELMSHAWDSEKDEFSNSVRVHLTTLRRKIKEVLGYNPICNKIGEGYYLTENKE